MMAMGVPTQIHITKCFVSKSMELKWVRRKFSKSSQLQNMNKNQLLLTPPLFPIYISTHPRHVDPHHLRNLFTDCNHSCHMFQNDAVVEPLDIHKLRIALSHSAVLVSVFCKPHHVYVDSDADDVIKMSSSVMGIAGLLQSVTPVTPSDGELVGFGRAVSDFGLTASIYDVMVTPSLRRMGIGQMIVKKILRMLTNRDIYDIAALCSEKERLFFKSCGFGGDILNSTTMMYTRTVSSTTQEGEPTIMRTGRKLLLIPPLKGLTNPQGQ
ncbi:hypothetical protein Lal_00002065 [Lupinus albus]|uniref:Putative transcription regulator GNAT family n=1 Tax=Lupinus albus TaxID=3870 RepID=A0A6A4PR45_LUPAL|nr:putative transcription regulator GNAT family [Lupinus albus]KAF1893573.1 hypothetical protein Lal_00002065 [Lupinus albus]